MIKPELLWNFIKTCEDTMKVGRVCRTLGRQDVEGVTADEVLLVRMIDNDSSWMDEKYEDMKRKDRERKRRKAEEFKKKKDSAIPMESTESAISTESTDSAPYLPTYLPTDKSNDLSPLYPPTEEEKGSDELFKRFWDAYPSNCPRKVDRKKCLEKFKRILRDGHGTKNEILEKLLEGLDLWKKSDTWSKDNGQFICAPLVWLNGERWNDNPLPKQSIRTGAEAVQRRRDIMNGVYVEPGFAEDLMKSAKEV